MNLPGTRRLEDTMRKRRTHYERIIRFVEEKPFVTLDAFLKKYPEIPSSTYHSTLNKLDRHGLLEKNVNAKRRTVYRKADQFSIESAIDTLRKANREPKLRKAMSLEEVVRDAVKDVVDPVTKLTFTQMQIDIEVKEKEPGFVEIDFAPAFCPMATELSKYVQNAASQICDIRKISVCCSGNIPRIKTPSKEVRQ